MQESVRHTVLAVETGQSLQLQLRVLRRRRRPRLLHLLLHLCLTEPRNTISQVTQRCQHVIFRMRAVVRHGSWIQLRAAGVQGAEVVPILRQIEHLG